MHLNVAGLDGYGPGAMYVQHTSNWLRDCCGSDRSWLLLYGKSIHQKSNTRCHRRCSAGAKAREKDGDAGGSAFTATYDQVTTETTGHAESVKVVYDPSKITYGQLLRIFFSVAHDPTQLNRQGPDVGTSYRSAIFYSDEEQHKISQAYIAQLDAAHVFPKPIVTQVVPLKGFYDAELYHQHYADQNPSNPYILVCDRPKIEALKQQFPELFQDNQHK
jgi:peptide-methionine (S)-S-oxide reductase